MQVLLSRVYLGRVAFIQSVLESSLEHIRQHFRIGGCLVCPSGKYCTPTERGILLVHQVSVIAITFAP